MLESNDLLSRGEKLLELFQPSGKQVEEIESSFAEQIVDKGGKLTTIQSQRWKSDSYQHIRCTKIWNDAGTLILNFGAFPCQDHSAPVIEAEFVILRGKVFVLVLEINDFVEPTTPLQNVAEKYINGLKREFKEHLPQDPDIPDWGKETKPGAFWSTPRSEEAVEPGFEIMSSFMRYATGLVANGQASDLTELETEERNGKLLHNFKVFHEYGPSMGFLRAYFSEEWAVRYMTEFLYPISIYQDQ